MTSDVPVMTARELLDELLRLQHERPGDFDDLAVYVEVVDLESYHAEQAATADDAEYTSTILGEGSAYAFQVHVPFASDSTRGEDYILIAAVELDDSEL